MTTATEERTVPWSHLDYIEVTVKDVDYVPNVGIAKAVAHNIGDSLARYEPRGAVTNVINLQEKTSQRQVADRTTVLFNNAQAHIEILQDRTEFGFHIYDASDLDAEIQSRATVLHRTAEALPIPQDAEAIHLTLLMNTTHPAPGWPLDGEHSLTQPFQTDNGLEFQHTLICRRDDEHEAQTGDASWDVVIHAATQENSMPGAHDLELLIKAAYTAAALVVLSHITDLTPQLPDA